jgi:polysaccharide export outer membrane protein
MKNIIKIIFMSVSVFLVFTLHAAQLPSNISPQQLAQFQKLPPAQQKLLAQSMGLNINTIKAQLNASSNKLPPVANASQLQQIYPRGTQFDEPILKDNIDVEQQSTVIAKLVPYGYDVFANAPMNFMAPSNDVVAPLTYVVGANDVLSIQIYGKENLSYELVISKEGKIVIPQLGPFAVSGMTISEVKAFLSSEIQNTMLGVDVIITLTKLRSLRVFF